MALLDDWMPVADVTTRHEVLVRADRAATYRVLTTTDFTALPLVRLLMGIRGLPSLLAGRRRRVRNAAPLPESAPFRGPLRGAFTLLAESPPEELVLGLTGRFWTPSGGLVPTDPATFRETPPPGTARAAWNFRLEPTADGHTRLLTETRVRAADDAARRSFLRYWRLVRPGSGLIRRAVLARVRREAEAGR